VTLTKNKVLQVLAIAALATFVITPHAAPFTSSWIVVLSGFLALPCFFTIVGIFAALNPRYRRIMLVSGVVTVPSILTLTGPGLFDVGFALLWPPETAVVWLYAIVLAGAGSLLSLGDLLLILLSWRAAKGIDLLQSSS